MHPIESYDFFAKNLCYLRKRYALTQKSLSRLTGISLPILRMTERGEVIPRLTDELVIRLCQIFNVTSEKLLNSDLSR